MTLKNRTAAQAAWTSDAYSKSTRRPSPNTIEKIHLGIKTPAAGSWWQTAPRDGFTARAEARFDLRRKVQEGRG